MFDGAMLNPFEILNLEPSYSLDLDVLESQYFATQKKTHPDQFSQGNEKEKAIALNKSTAVNQAYLLLKDPLLRAEYLLKQAGIELYSNDPIFLEQIMAWNESLSQGENLRQELKMKEKQLLDTLEGAFAFKEYEKASHALYQLAYIKKLLRQWEEE